MGNKRCVMWLIAYGMRYNRKTWGFLILRKGMGKMNIKGKFVTLRAMTKADMEMICDMFNDPDMEHSVVGWAFPISLEQQYVWFESHMGDQSNHRFVVETEDDGALGIATLTDIDWKNRSACHGMKLANRQSRGKGIGTDTVMAVMRYAFDELGLHRLDTGILDENVASKALYKKCGWKEEGMKRSSIYKGGEWKNLVLVGILDEDYRKTAARLGYWD